MNQQPVATVNGAPIDQKALSAAMQSLAQENFHATLDEVPRESHAELRSMALDRLIARELIFQAALAEGFIASEEDVAEESARILRMMGQPQDFWQRLAERGMDEASFLRMVRKDVTVDRFSAQRLLQVKEPQEEEIKAFFAAYPDRLRDPERVRASHILLAVDPDDPDKARQRAEALRSEAQTDFAAVAKRHSVCASAPGGGELGFIKREDVDPTFADAAFSQIVNEVGPPVRTSYGYHLIKVTAREIPAPPTLEDCRNKIVNFLQKAEGAGLLQAWVAEMRENSEIVLCQL